MNRLATVRLSTITIANLIQPACQTLLGRVVWHSWLAVGLLTILFSTNLSLPGWIQYLPFIVSIILFGLPHGAVDHFVVPRLQKEPVRLTFLAGFIGGYLVLVGIYLMLWFAYPAAALIFFIVLTWFHWGQGDLFTLLALGRSRYPDGVWPRILTVIVRGGFPMLVPFLAFPELYRAEAQNLIHIFAPDASGQITWAFASSMRWVAGVSFALAVLISLGLGYRQARRSNKFTAWRIDVWECLLLAAYFSLVPPVLAIGVYFCLWHATRHIARLIGIDPQMAKDLQPRHYSTALARFSRDALPLTLGALLILVGLYFIMPYSPENIRDVVALYLAFIAALTFPHVIIVCWMDWHQGVWNGASKA